MKKRLAKIILYPAVEHLCNTWPITVMHWALTLSAVLFFTKRKEHNQQGNTRNTTCTFVINWASFLDTYSVTCIVAISWYVLYHSIYSKYILVLGTSFKFTGAIMYTVCSPVCLTSGILEIPHNSRDIIPDKHH